MVKSIIKNTPIIGPFLIWSWQKVFYKNKKNVKPYIFKRIEYDNIEGEPRRERQLLNVLNYTKTSGSSYSAYRYPAGYHTLKINGRIYEGQRNPSERLADVPIDFNGKTILDIGCNQGGMLYELDGLIKYGVGIDYDYRMINAANLIKTIRKNTNLNFYVFNLEKEPLDLIGDFIPSLKVDVVFLLSVCMWINNWKDVIKFCTNISNTMLFESNGDINQQTMQEDYIKYLYKKVIELKDYSSDDPHQKKRKLYYCVL